MTAPDQIEAVARAIMLARDNGGCEVKDWQREAQDNPHVAQAIQQAKAAIAAMHGWRPLSDTQWLDGRDVLIKAHDMIVQARYSAGSWSNDTPIAPAEYDGAVWVCFDDEFQFEIEEISNDPAIWHHGPVTAWMPLPSVEAHHD